MTATGARPLRPAEGPDDSLRAAGQAAGCRIGAAVDHAALAGDPRYAATLAREFDALTPENAVKWAEVHPAPGAWRFGPADDLVAFAEAHAMRVKGHVLVWHEQLPAWVGALAAPGALRRALEDHIRTLVSRYAGRVTAWDVVNEAVDDAGSGLRSTLFLERLGPGYLAAAFHAARAADPRARLLYNDYGAEAPGAKADRVHALLGALLDADVPVDGVGLQCHLAAGAGPRPAAVARTVRRLAALGLRVELSELDVGVRAGDREGLRAQAAAYRALLDACLSTGCVDAITVWGVSDGHSWRRREAPLLFDPEYARKPAHGGVLAALRGRARHAAASLVPRGGESRGMQGSR